MSEIKARNSIAKNTKEQELVITRIFDAPRGLVWKAWTNPERVKRWWGPKGFTSPVCKIDLRVGGEYLNAMRSPEGQEFWSKGVYREIVAPERLVRCRISRDCPYDKLDSSDSFKRVAERPFQANWGR